MYSKNHTFVGWLNIIHNKRCERAFWISRPAYCCLITCRHLRDVGGPINDDHSWINVTRAFPVAKRYVDESKMGRLIVPPNQRNVTADGDFSWFIWCRNKSLAITCLIHRARKLNFKKNQSRCNQWVTYSHSVLIIIIMHLTNRLL